MLLYVFLIVSHPISPSLLNRLLFIFLLDGVCYGSGSNYIGRKHSTAKGWK